MNENGRKKLDVGSAMNAAKVVLLFVLAIKFILNKHPWDAAAALLVLCFFELLIKYRHDRRKALLAETLACGIMTAAAICFAVSAYF